MFASMIKVVLLSAFENMRQMNKQMPFSDKNISRMRVKTNIRLYIHTENMIV